MKINIIVILSIILLSYSFAKISISNKENIKASLSRRSKIRSKVHSHSHSHSHTHSLSLSKTNTTTNSTTNFNTNLTTNSTLKATTNSTTIDSNNSHKVNAAKHAYPNPTHSPVSKENLKEYKQMPYHPLSGALKELDYSEKVKRQVFLDTIKYAYFKMTKAEANMLFNIIDTDKDDLISPQEYHEFSVLYIMPFEACDTGKDHLLSLKDFKLCFAKDPKRQEITFRRRHEDKKEVEELIMNMISTRGKPIMNIFDYVIFRRALYAWTKCTSSAKVMTKAAFKCAITTFITNKYLGKFDTDLIFNVGISYGQGANLIDLDFISYLRISYYTLAFVTFNESNPTSQLEKIKFLKAVSGDAFPNNFNEAEIHLIYSLTNNSSSMDFPNFAFFFHFHRLFNKYSSRTPFKLTEKEYYEFIKDMEIPMLTRLKIDRSFVKFTQPEYLEASLTLGKKRLDETKFFSFKQDGTVEGRSVNDKKTANANAIAILKNKVARKYFYHINSIIVNNEKIWDKECMYKAFLYSALYNRILELSNGYSNNKAFIDNLLKGYETSVPSVSVSLRANVDLYKTLPDEINIDLLLFQEINNSLRKMGVRNFNDDTMVDEVNMKIMMQDFGMELMPDTVLDTGARGKDKLGRRIFSAVESYKNLMVVQGVAAEKQRSNRDIRVNKLVKNTDRSRKFPQNNRRLEKSPMV